MSSSTTAATEIHSIAPGLAFPSSAQRNPSTTPAIGFKPYQVRHLAGTRLVEYATGVANIQNCVRNGTVYRMSRNCTLRAESQSPIERVVAMTRRVNGGSSRIEPVGV